METRLAQPDSLKPASRKGSRAELKAGRMTVMLSARCSPAKAMIPLATAGPDEKGCTAIHRSPVSGNIAAMIGPSCGESKSHDLEARAQRPVTADASWN